MSYIVTPSGQRMPIEPENGKRFTLEELQKAVGGYIDLIDLGHGQIMVINDNGKFQGLEPNLVATKAAHRARSIAPNDYIVGPAVICNDDQLD